MYGFVHVCYINVRQQSWLYITTARGEKWGSQRDSKTLVFVLAFVSTVFFVCVSLCMCLSGVTSTGRCFRKRNAEEIEGDRQGRQSGLQEEIWFFISTTVHPTSLCAQNRSRPSVFKDILKWFSEGEALQGRLKRPFTAVS